MRIHAPLYLHGTLLAGLGLAMWLGARGQGGALVLVLLACGLVSILLMRSMAARVREVVLLQEDAESYVTAALSLSGHAVVLLDAEGAAVHVGPEGNRLAQGLQGLSGRFPLAKVHPEDMDRVSQALDGTLPPGGLRYRIALEKGAWQWVRDLRTPFLSHGAGGRQGTLALLVPDDAQADLEEARQMGRQLEDRVAQVRASVHDLNDALMALQAQLDLGFPAEPAREQIHQSLDRVLELGRQVFSVVVPPNDAEELPRMAPARAAAGGTSVLLVDDEESLRRALRMGLERRGFKVFEAEDGVEGFATFIRHRAEIGVALVDLAMPRMGGDQLFMELKRLDPGLPVVLMSGYHHQDVLARLEGEVPAGFLLKPSSLADVVNVTRKALGLD